MSISILPFQSPIYSLLLRPLRSPAHHRQILTRFAQAARTLTRLVLNKDYSNDYLYYGIPTPWLQIKLLRMLQVC